MIIKFNPIYGCINDIAVFVETLFPTVIPVVFVLASNVGLDVPELVIAAWAGFIPGLITVPLFAVTLCWCPGSLIGWVCWGNSWALICFKELPPVAPRLTVPNVSGIVPTPTGTLPWKFGRLKVVVPFPAPKTVPIVLNKEAYVAL